MGAGTEHDTGSVEIEPEEGYEVRSQFGLARCGPAAGDRLVRLADVVRWYMASPRELPFINALDEVCGRINEATIEHVFRVNGQGYAKAAAYESKWHYFDSAKEPGWNYQKQCAEYCVRDMRNGWCGDKHWMAKVLNDPEYAPNEYDPFSESRFVYWERKGERDSGPSAGSYAIRFSMAHELWGWGQAVASEAEQAAPALQPGDVVDWPSLVRYRRQFDGVAVQKRPEWLPEHVALLGGRLREEGQAGRGRGALGRMAKELGYSREVRLRQILEGGAYDLRTGEKKKAAATPFDGMGTVLTGTS